MARWTDLAQWRGPSPNINAGKQTEVRGLVVHIAAGWYEGTISWQKNPKSDVSSHFVVSRKGEVAQMVDTADAAWTQRSGNGEWLSVECEGFIASDSKNPGGWERLSDAQLDAVARLLARCHEEYGVPLQATTSPTGKGLGHHSMGADWGHRECPGAPIIAQKPAIVERARALKNGDDDMPTVEDVWGWDGIPAPKTAIKDDPKNKTWAPGSYLQWTYNNVSEVRADQAAIRRDQAAHTALLTKLVGAQSGLTAEEVAAAVADGVKAALPSVAELAAAVAAAVDHDLDTAAVEAALRTVLGGVDEDLE